MTGLARYRRLWQVPGAPLLLVGGVVARLGQGVTVLAWLLLVKETTGGFSGAGLVGACISLATAATAPVAGRLADRFGAGRVLPLYATAYALLQLLLLVAVLARMPRWSCSVSWRRSPGRRSPPSAPRCARLGPPSLTALPTPSSSSGNAPMIASLQGESARPMPSPSARRGATKSPYDDDLST
jgi:MFS family permease